MGRRTKITDHDIYIPIDYVVSFGEAIHPIFSSRHGVVATVILTEDHVDELLELGDVRSSATLTFTKTRLIEGVQKANIPFLRLTKAQLVDSHKSTRFPKRYEARVFGTDWAGFANFEIDSPMPTIGMWDDIYNE